MRKRNIMKKVMSLVLGGCIAIGAAGCGALVPPAGIDPVPDTPDIPEQPERVREERDLISRIAPSNRLDEEKLPSAGSRVFMQDGIYGLKGEGFSLRLVKTADNTFKLSVVAEDGAVCAEEKLPAQLYFRCDGLVSAGYGSVTTESYGLKATAVLTSEKGSELVVDDLYYFPEQSGSAFNVRRSVSVRKASASDKGFESLYTVSAPSGGVNDYSWFVPNNVFGEFPKNGVSYVESKIFRETLLGLPYAMFRENKTGLTFSLGRYQPAVTPADNSFASVALLGGDGAAIEIAYPARDSARRYFDIEEGKQIVYDMTLRAERSASFSQATASVYNAHFDLQDQRVVATDIDEVYSAVCKDFKTFLLSTTANGVTSYGLPWRVTIENGKIGPKSYQAGFVGQQIPAAYNMLHYGVRENDTKSFRNGMRVLDFWVNAGMMTEKGVPKIWYGGDANYFWKYPTFLRMAVDAMEGLLDGYRLVTAHGIERQTWRAAIVSFADFLVREQNADGSWWRCYNWDGKIFRNGDNGISEPGGNICQSDSKLNSTMPVRFLGKMYELTGDAKYKASAIKGGEYVYKNIYPTNVYTGGTCDNANAVDKEAGVYAMYCYDALYMLTGESKWLECLKQAAAFTMSAVITYSFDINENSTQLKAALALKHGYTDGLSFIVCGGTGVDNYVAYIYYELFRIYIMTGDKTYLRQSEFIQQNTKSTMDWDGALGYAYKSLVPEATTIYSFGFASATDDDGVMGVWLPWASVANAEPIAKMYDHFGKADVKEFGETSLEVLRSQLNAYGVGGGAHRKYVTSAINGYIR